MRSELVDWKAKGARAIHEPVVIAGEHDGLSLVSKKIHRRQMKRIQSSYRLWKGFQGSREHRRRELYESKPAQQCPNLIRVRSREFPAVNARPNLILDKPAGNERFSPESFRRHAVFCNDMRERNVGVNPAGNRTGPALPEHQLFLCACRWSRTEWLPLGQLQRSEERRAGELRSGLE